jgi:cellulose synthase/poly-beta-1,6-N-acetylglucosamine synthase-like glycosyltransferase
LYIIADHQDRGEPTDDSGGVSRQASRMSAPSALWVDASVVGLLWYVNKNIVTWKVEPMGALIMDGIRVRWFHAALRTRQQYHLLMNIDPDHVPASTFPREVLGYFEDPQIGYVRVAQAY